MWNPAKDDGKSQAMRSDAKGKIDKPTANIDSRINGLQWPSKL